MKPLSIAFLVSIDNQSGTYFRYHNLAVALTQLGHQVTVYSQSKVSPSLEIRDQVRYVFTSAWPGNRWVSAGVNPGNILNRILQSYQPADIFHVFQSFPNTAIPWLRLQQQYPQSLFAYDWDDLWVGGLYQDPKNYSEWSTRWLLGWLDRMERSLPRRCQLLTSCSQFLIDKGIERGATLGRVIHNGFWPYCPTAKPVARAELNLQPDAIYAGFMGWTPTEIDWCFHGLREVADQFPTLRLAFCGFDPQAFLQQFPDLAARVDYLGVLSPSRSRIFNNALDIGLLPLADSPLNRSRQPIKFAEYLAGGTPVLCTEVGEVGRLAQRIPGCVTCEANLPAWSQAFRDMVLQLSTLPESLQVDLDRLQELLSWIDLGAQLQLAYQTALN